MVYMTPKALGWMPYVETWLNNLFEKATNFPVPEEGKEEQGPKAQLKDMFIAYIQASLDYMENLRDQEPIKTYDIQNVTSLCNFLEYFLVKEITPNDEKKVWLAKMVAHFSFCFMWAFGGSFNSKTQEFKIDGLVQEHFSKVKYPNNEEPVFSYFINPKDLKPVNWSTEVPKEFQYDAKLPYFSILVPTQNTVRYSYLLDLCLTIKKHCFFTGETGVGKSVVIQNYIAKNRERKLLNPFFLNFSAQTDSYNTQALIEDKLEKVGTAFGSPGGQTTLIFVDDINMPSVEKYGAQPPIELLRQIISEKGFYTRPPDKFEWKHLVDYVLVCAAAPPSGGRSALTP